MGPESQIGNQRKLIAQAASARRDLIATGRLKNRSTFSRNIALFFEGPKDSTLDSQTVKARKRLTLRLARTTPAILALMLAPSLLSRVVAMRIMPVIETRTKVTTHTEYRTFVDEARSRELDDEGRRTSSERCRSL